MNAKKALGRGLSAIIDDVEEAYRQDIEDSIDDSNDLVREIPVDLISPNPYQPRTYFNEEALQELSDSIKQHGLLQPIIVVKKDDRFILLAGERRLRATKLAGIDRIKAIIADIKSQHLRELALIENIQREDLNPIELAISYKELIEEYNITQEGLAGIIHKSRTQITNTIRLLSLAKKTQELLSSGKLSQGHAKIIVGLSPEDEKDVVNTILGQKLSVRDTELLVKKIKTQEKPTDKKKRPIPIEQESLKSLKVKLFELGFKSKISHNSITITLDDEEKIESFFKRLS
ncbi:ParB/RepB/Spo0J family partition protein [Sulfurospirillum sp. 1612]|uniref:ParB/RepB/Spo0J family partition protein n=1 Tax=Sulfurospirillum sp. 1612 TaxID=3094835 RepID=UPI002F926501